MHDENDDLKREAGREIVSALKVISENLRRHEELLHALQHEILMLGGAVKAHQVSIEAMTGQGGGEPRKNILN